MYNDGKVQNIKAICLRNLYLPVPDHTTEKHHEQHNTNTDGHPRRMSLLQSLPEFERPGTHLELLDINNRKLVDSFVSIHLVGKDQKLIYVSEVRHCNMHPNFSEISLPFIPRFNKSHSVVIKVWCRSNLKPTKNWTLLSLFRLDLRKLQLIGDSIENLEDIFKKNSIIVNLNDRYYTVPKSFKYDPKLIHSHKHTKSSTKVLNAYTFDSLRAINNLTRSLQELSVTKHKLSKQIEGSIDLLYDTSNIANITITLGKVRNSVQVLENAAKTQKSRNDTISSEIINTRIRISQIKELTNEKINSILEMGVTQTEIAQAQVDPINEALVSSVYPSLLKQLQSTSKVVREAFPITSLDNTLGFRILGLQFPSSIKELLEICYYDNHPLKSQDQEEEGESHQSKITQVNAGITYIVQLINHLAEITNTNLKYKMVASGNETIIVDPIFAEKLSSQYNTATIPNTGNYDSDQSALIFPLYYAASTTERISIDAELSTTGRNFLLMNKDFELGLNMLNKNLILLINNVTDVYHDFRGSDREERYKVSNSIPIDSVDNFLWNLQYLILFITAPIDE